MIVPLDTGVPSGASTYPLTPGSSTTGCGGTWLTENTRNMALTSMSRVTGKTIMLAKRPQLSNRGLSERKPGLATLDARGDEPVRYDERRLTSLNTSCRPTQYLLHDS